MIRLPPECAKSNFRRESGLRHENYGYNGAHPIQQGDFIC